MDRRFERTAEIAGIDGVRTLSESSVIVFGAGGVGASVIEALARSGVGRLTIVDGDTIDITNVNRQIHALDSTVGRLKAQVMKERIEDINPECRVETRICFFMPDNSHTFDFRGYDYVVDAVDTVKAKIEIIEKASRESVPVISSMGTAGKTDPSAFRADLIENTRVCPLARVMRREMRKRGLKKIKAVYSEEEPVKGGGTMSFVPPAAGLVIAGEVVRELLRNGSGPWGRQYDHGGCR